MLQIVSAAARNLMPTAADVVSADDMPTPPIAAERLRAAIEEAKGSGLRNAEKVLRAARQQRAEASERCTGAIQAAVAKASASRTSQTAAEVVAERALAVADAAIDAPLSRLQAAREGAEPRIRAAAAPHLKEAGEKLAAAAAAIGEVRAILVTVSRFCAENAMTSSHSAHSLPSARALKDLADRLEKGVL